MRKCDKYRELMNLALDDAITEYERKRLNDHLASCQECRLINEALRSISEAISEDMVEPPESLAKNVMREIKSHRHFSWKGFAAIAACFVLIVSAAGVGLVQQRNAAVDPGSASAYTQASDVDDSGTYDHDALSADAGDREHGLRSSQTEPEEPQRGGENGEAGAYSDTTESEKELNYGDNSPEASEPEPSGSSQTEPNESAGGSVSLMDVPSDVFEDMVSAEVYFSGSVDSSEPDVTLTSAEELELLAELLTYESASGIPVPESEALITVIVIGESGNRTEVRVWRSNSELLMEFNGELYTVSGVLEDLLALVGW